MSKVTNLLILDVGCGERPRGDVNCDIELRKNVENFVLCNAEYLPFKDNSFDIVISFYVIEHVPNIYKFLYELHRIARKVVLLVTDNSLWYVDLVNFILRSNARFTYEGHFHIFHPDQVKRLLHKLGYKAIVISGNFGLEAEHMKRRELLVKNAFGLLFKLLAFILTPFSKNIHYILHRDIMVIIIKDCDVDEIKQIINNVLSRSYALKQR